jgi:hypothetical protein
MKTRITFATAALAAVSLLAGPARAAVLCVSPTGAGGCQTTIQAAVDLAGAGDTIVIGAGVYYEAVSVNASKEGLKLVGRGRRAVIDASPYFDRGFAGADVALGLDAAAVEVRNLVFRNGLVGIAVRRPAAILEDLEFRGTDQPIFVDFAADVQVLSSAFFDCFACIGGGGPGLVVRGNRFERAGASLSIGNLVAPHAQIVDNRVEGVAGGLLVANNVETTLRGNRLRHSGELGARGPNPVVEHNTLEEGLGITANCSEIDLEPGPGGSVVPVDCTRSSVSGNRVTDAGGVGLGVTGEAPGSVIVRDNVLLRTDGLALGGGGFVLPGVDPTSNPMLVEANRVQSAGFSRGSIVAANGAGSCVQVFAGGLPGSAGTGPTVRGNVAKDCAGAGFYVAAERAVVEGNHESGAAGSGFVVGGFQADTASPPHENELRGNTATGNAAQGIAIRSGATLTQVVDNVAARNRTDFCDEGTDTVASGNSFGTTGDCLIDR